MTERPEAPPEGTLIKAALTASRISQRAAARRAGISETRWRQIVSGYQAVGGEKVSFRSPDETLARMAHVVGVLPDQLEAAGRPAAAAALRDIEADAPGADAGGLPPGSQARVEERWHMLEGMLRQARIGLSPSEYSTLLDKINVYFAHTPKWRPPSGAPAPEEQGEPAEQQEQQEQQGEQGERAGQPERASRP